jgi:hypothetical protein
MSNVKVKDYLEQLRQRAGEEAWKAEVRRLAKQALNTGKPGHEVFWRELTKDYAWFDLDALKQEPPDETDRATMDHMVLTALRREMPLLKSQEQFNAFRAAFDAFKAVLNAIFENKPANEVEARKLLEMAFTATHQTTELTRKLSDVPEAATSEAAEGFKNPPLEFGEYDELRALLAELAPIESNSVFDSWYSETKQRRDRIRTQSLRNTLIDTIRAKTLSFQERS